LVNRQIIDLISNTQKIKKSEDEELDILINKYPYFSTAHLLLVKALSNIDSIRFNKQLKKTAAYTANRQLLFKLVTERTIIEEKESLEKSIQEQSTTEKLKVGQPLKFNSEESYSFSEWLNISNIKKIKRGKENNTTQIVDNFISQQPTIKTLKKTIFFSPSEKAKESLIENNEIVTETLARVYLEQKYYEKAIAAYEKLSLKYPQKNSFFAEKIKLILKLKEN